jgi:hypothetical protein
MPGDSPRFDLYDGLCEFLIPGKSQDIYNEREPEPEPSEPYELGQLKSCGVYTEAEEAHIRSAAPRYWGDVLRIGFAQESTDRGKTFVRRSRAYSASAFRRSTSYRICSNAFGYLNWMEGEKQEEAQSSYHHKCKPHCDKFKQDLEYFWRNFARMDYARLRAQNLPIGSGVVEATCKHRLPRAFDYPANASRENGGQAILTFRALAQSDRFDAVWK